MKNHRCAKTLEEFIEYMDNNPDQRFFQGIRNFFNIGFLIADNIDTFYWETDDEYWTTAEN